MRVGRNVRRATILLLGSRMVASNSTQSPMFPSKNLMNRMIHHQQFCISLIVFRSGGSINTLGASICKLLRNDCEFQVGNALVLGAVYPFSFHVGCHWLEGIQLAVKMNDVSIKFHCWTFNWLEFRLSRVQLTEFSTILEIVQESNFHFFQHLSISFKLILVWNDQKWIKMGWNISIFHVGSIFRMNRNGIDWTRCQNDQFFKNLCQEMTKFGENLVKIDDNFKLDSFFELKKMKSIGPGVKMTNFSNSFCLEMTEFGENLVKIGENFKLGSFFELKKMELNWPSVKMNNFPAIFAKWQSGEENYSFFTRLEFFGIGCHDDTFFLHFHLQISVKIVIQLLLLLLPFLLPLLRICIMQTTTVATTGWSRISIGLTVETDSEKDSETPSPNSESFGWITFEYQRPVEGKWENPKSKYMKINLYFRFLHFIFIR